MDKPRFPLSEIPILFYHFPDLVWQAVQVVCLGGDYGRLVTTKEYLLSLGGYDELHKVRRQIGVGSILGYGRPVDDGLAKELRLHR